jgi:hypothetical protein
VLLLPWRSIMGMDMGMAMGMVTATFMATTVITLAVTWVAVGAGQCRLPLVASLFIRPPDPNRSLFSHPLWFTNKRL